MRIRNEMDPFGHSVRGGGYDNPCVESPDVLYGPTAIDSDALPWSLLNLGSLYFNRDGKEWSYKAGDTEWRALASHAYDVRAWGAKGDGTTDDSTAIQAACDAATTAGCTVHFPHGTFLCATGITIGSHCTADPCATINYTGSGTAITLSDTTAIMYKEIHLPKVVMAEDHVNATIGVHVKGVNSCQIWVPYVGEFARGLVISGDASLNSNKNANYLTVYVGTLHDNKINVDLTAESGCCVNQNTFLCGRTYQGAAHATRDPGYNQIRLNDASNNTFINWSLEGDTAEYTINCTFGSYNVWLNCRFEAAPYVYWGAGSIANQILYGTGARDIVQTSASGAYGNHVTAEDLRSLKFSALAINSVPITTTELNEFAVGELYNNSTPLVPAEKTTAVATIYAVGNVFSGFIHVITRSNRTAAIYSVAASEGSYSVTLVSKEPAAAAFDALPAITWSSGDAIHTLSMTLNDQFTASPVVVVFAQLYGEDLKLTWLL